MRRTDFSALFASAGPGLRRLMARFGPGISAEDVAQDAFARMAAVDVEAIKEPRAWLARTAQNVALNEIRRRKTGPIDAYVDVSALETAADTPTPEDELIAREALDLLHQTLEALPAHQRAALVLFKIDGLSHKEVGARLGVSPRTVERYVADALVFCHDRLRAYREDGAS